MDSSKGISFPLNALGCLGAPAFRKVIFFIDMVEEDRSAVGRNRGSCQFGMIIDATLLGDRAVVLPDAIRGTLTPHVNRVVPPDPKDESLNRLACKTRRLSGFNILFAGGCQDSSEQESRRRFF